MRRLLFMGILVCAVPLTTASECGDDPLAALGGSIDITLINDSSRNIHFFVGSETFPCCFLAPDAERTVAVHVDQPGGDLNFSVGWDQEVRTQNSFEVLDCYVGTGQMRVVYDLPAAPGAIANITSC